MVLGLEERVEVPERALDQVPLHLLEAELAHYGFYPPRHRGEGVALAERGVLAGHVDVETLGCGRVLLFCRAYKDRPCDFPGEKLTVVQALFYHWVAFLPFLELVDSLVQHAD